MRKQRALIVSPFATAPLDAGQRLRAHQSTRAFEALGYEITFLLYAFENTWYWKNQPALLKQMVAQWGDVRVVFSQRQVSLPPKTGATHRIDEWWDPQLDVMLSQMFAFEDFDLCVVHNVWLSKAFDFVPRRVSRVLDTHDVFSARSAAFAAVGAKPEFLVVDKDDETFGLERADLVLTIKPQEAALLQGYGLRRPVLNLPYCPAPAPAAVRRKTTGMAARWCSAFSAPRMSSTRSGCRRCSSNSTGTCGAASRRWS